MATMHSAPETAPYNLSGLANRAIAALQSTFTARGHFPGGTQWAALRALVGVMEGMADGTAEQAIHLASLDPGSGKSTSVVEFARVLVRSAEHRDAGMLVCVGRLDEARALASDMIAAGIGQHVAVLTRDDEANALSGSAAPGAQILITTQQLLERRTRTVGLLSCGLFHFNGAPRAVRVWDESWLPGVTITLDSSQLGAVFGVANRLNRQFGRALEDMFIALREVPDQALFDVPDWTACGVIETDVLSGCKSDEARVTAAALFVISGRAIRVHREPYANANDDRILVSFKDTLPADIAPLLVLDASIRVRQTYADAVKHRGVKMLPVAEKDYGPLTVHLWKAAASKTGWLKNREVLLDGCARTIMAKPTEHWLVVTHRKDSRVGSIEAQLKRGLPPGVASNVSVITWGMHQATNAFRDYGNVILAGTLFMPTARYLALTHLAQNRPPEVHGFAEAEDVKKTTHGEHRNLILQAALRGRARQADGDRCQPMDLYLIAAAGSGIPTAENMEIMFPGCQVKRWAPVAPKLAGRALDASIVMGGLLDSGALAAANDFLPYSRISDLMPGKDGAPKVMHVRDFKRRVADSDPWRDHLATLGLIETTRPGRRHPTPGLRLAAEGELPDWQEAA